MNNSGKVRMLYKTILKLHRGLPPELNQLGSEYVRAEFKRHKQCNTQQAKIFLSEWSQYALTLAEQLGIRGPATATKQLGRSLSEDDLAHFKDEQIVQLYELLQISKENE